MPTQNTLQLERDLSRHGVSILVQRSNALKADNHGELTSPQGSSTLLEEQNIHLILASQCFTGSRGKGFMAFTLSHEPSPSYFSIFRQLCLCFNFKHKHWLVVLLTCHPVPLLCCVRVLFLCQECPQPASHVCVVNHKIFSTVILRHGLP